MSYYKKENYQLVWVDFTQPGGVRLRAPRNFWHWCRKAQKCWILERHPKACAIHNATPFGMNGRHYFYLKNK